MDGWPMLPRPCIRVINVKICLTGKIYECIVQQIYYRLFRGQTVGNKNRQGGNSRITAQRNGSRRQGQRPFTRAEALLVMLEQNGCPPEQLQTLRNTVQNQDVKNIPPEDFFLEQKKRGDRRVEIDRPKRSVMFVLEENKTKEFRISDIVQSDERVIKSADRNEPNTEGRLVKLKPTTSAAASEDNDEIIAEGEGKEDGIEKDGAEA